MGKSRKNRKRKNRKTYNKDEFCNIFCPKCSLCLTKAEPIMCYWFYKNNKKKFLNQTFKELNNLEWPTENYIQLSLFTNLFCDKCSLFSPDEKGGPICKDVKSCFDLFRSQIDPVYSNKLYSTDFEAKVLKKYLKNHIEKKEKKEKYIVQPYLTFFYSKADPEWEKELNAL